METLTLEIALQVDEVERLTEIAEEFETSPEELLARFVADLTESNRTGGSDERMFAEQWLNRRHPVW